MTTSHWTRAALIAVLVAPACTGGEKPTPTPTPQATTPPTPTPAPTPTPPPTPTPTAPPEPVAEAAIEGIGPFKSVAAYCKDVKSKFVPADCKSMMDDGADMCACGTGKGDVLGKRKIGPLPEATGLASAELLLVARSAAGARHCDLAIETANGRGWFMVPALMPCGEAPIAHDAGTSVTITGFDITREDDVDVLTLAWTETTSDQDVDGKQTTRDDKFTTRCTIGAATLPRCASPTKQ